MEVTSVIDGFADGVGAGVGGYAGGKLGSYLFKAIGIDPKIGAIIGGTVGGAAGVYAVQEIEYALDETSQAPELLSGLASAGIGAAIGIFEQATGITPVDNAFNGNPSDVQAGAAVGGAIGAVVGVVFSFGAATAALEQFGEFLGSVIGSMFGPPPSVGPNAYASLGIQTDGTGKNAFAINSTGSDNGGGSLLPGITGIAQAVAALINGEIAAVGGTLIIDPNRTTSTVGVSWFKGELNDSLLPRGTGHGFPDSTARFFTSSADDPVVKALYNQYPNLRTTDLHSDSAYQQLVNDAVVRQLQLADITGGSDTLVQALKNSFLAYDASYFTDAQVAPTVAGQDTNSGPLPASASVYETLTQLNYDLQAYADYQAYQANPLSFLLGFALREQAAQDAATAAGETTTVDAVADWAKEQARGALLQHVYAYTRGSGTLVINNYSETNQDSEGIIALTVGPTLADVVLSRSGNDLVFTLNSSNTDKIVVQNVFDPMFGAQYGFGELRFYDQYGAPELGAGTIAAPNAEGLVSQTLPVWRGADLLSLLPTNPSALLRLSDIQIVKGSNQSSLSYSGDGKSLFLEGDSNTLTDAMNQGALLANGQNNHLQATGNGNLVTANGTGDALVVTGGSNTVVANGAGSAVILSGTTSAATADKVTIGEGSVTFSGAAYATINGVSDTISTDSVSGFGLTIGGDQMTVNVYGSNGTLQLGGDSETLTITGTNNIIEMDGQNNTVYLEGSNNKGNANGSVAGLKVSGNNDTVIVTGGGNSLEVDGIGNTVSFSNVNNSIKTAGDAITVADNATATVTMGGGDDITVGSNASVTVAESGIDLQVQGSGSTVSLNGADGQVKVSGRSNTISIVGDDDDVDLQGSSATLTLSGKASRISIEGTGEQLKVSGSTLSVASNASLTLLRQDVTYSNGNIITLGDGATLADQGANNWVTAGAGDTVTLDGTGNGIKATGLSNTVNFTSYGEFAEMNGGTLNLTGSAQVTLVGDNNVVNVSKGTSITAYGTGNQFITNAPGSVISLAKAPDNPLIGKGSSNTFATRGFAYPSFSQTGYGAPSSTASFAALQATGANAVQFVPTQYVSNINDTNIAPTAQSESDADLTSAISQAVAAHMQVLLKPHVDPVGDVWRASLGTSSGSQVGTQASDTYASNFFANYTPFMVHYAQIAQATGAQMLSIGSEMVSLTGQAFKPYWEDLISKVRQVYSGKITYSSAWLETSNVSFWGDVDVIGANPYEAITGIENPTLDQLKAGWTAVPSDSTEAAKLNNQSPVAFYKGLHDTYGKPILFTEIGYRSVNATNKLDGDYGTPSYEDYQQQSLALQAFFSVMSTQSWLQGAYLWDWNPDATDVVTDDFSVQGKPALDVVDSWYGAASSPDAQQGLAVSVTAAAGNVTTVQLGAGVPSSSVTVAAPSGNEAVTVTGSNDSIVLNGVTSPSTAVGTGWNLLGSGADTFTRSLFGQLQVGEGGRTIAITNSNGTPNVIDPLARLIGLGQNLLGFGGHDVLESAANGQLVGYEVNDFGAVLASINATNGGSAFPVAPQATIIGVGQNLLNSNGHDVFERLGSSQLVDYEFNGAGALVGYLYTTNGGSAFPTDTKSTVIGVGQNLLGENGHDIFQRLSSGQLVDYEFSDAGALVAYLYTTSNGGAFVLDQQSTVAGSGQDLLGAGGHDIFVRLETGQLVDYEFNASGAVVGGLAFTNVASFVVDQSVTVVGTGQDLLGAGGHDVLLRLKSGQLAAYEFDYNGHLIKSLSFSDQANLDQNTVVVGVGQNLLGQGGHDIFSRTSTGQLIAREYNDYGTDVSAYATTNGGGAFPIDQQSAVIGVGQGLTRNGGEDVVERTSTGQLTIYEFASNGALTSYYYTTVQGSPIVIDQETSAIGWLQNYFGAGGTDVVLRSGSNQLGVLEFDGGGGLIAGAWATYAGQPWGPAEGARVVGSGNGLYGGGESDLFVRQGDGTLAAYYMSPSLQVQGAALMYYASSPLVLDTGAKVVSTGIDFNTGAPDFVLRYGYGAVVTYDAQFSARSNSVSAGRRAGSADDASSRGTDGLTGTMNLVTETGTNTTIMADGSFLQVGTPDADTLGATGGNSTIFGNGGGDTFVFDNDDQKQVIINGLSTSSSASGTLTIGGYLNPSNIWFERVDRNGVSTATGTDLRADVLGTNRSSTIEDWYAPSGGAGSAGDLSTTGSALHGVTLGQSGMSVDSEISSLVQAMSVFEAQYSQGANGTAFDPTMPGAVMSDPTLLAAVNRSWHA